jgi:hypothetical protein
VGSTNSYAAILFSPPTKGYGWGADGRARGGTRAFETNR